MTSIIVQYDDIYKGNDKIEVFDAIHNVVPDFKVTFFVIMHDFVTKEYLDSLKRDWIEFVYHADEHHGDWLKWDKETAKKNILKCQEYGFAKGFKAPGWKLTRPIIEACNELDYWCCICGTEPILKEIKPNKAWVTRHLGFNVYNDYTEMYGHIQENDFLTNISKLKEYIRVNKCEFKYISEIIKAYA